MAASYDNSAASYQSTSLGFHTFSYTTGAIANGIMLVGVRLYDAGDRIISGYPKYAGVSMTLVYATNIGGDHTYGFYLPSPASGTNDITIDVYESYRCEVSVITLSGALQTGQPDVYGGDSASSGTASVTATTVADNVVGVLFSWMNGASGAFSNGTNCTVSASVNDRTAVGYSGAKTPAGSLTMSMGLGGSGLWRSLLIGVSPALSGPANVKTIGGLALASVKTVGGLAIADVKTIGGLA